MLIGAVDLKERLKLESNIVVFDCRFQLSNPNAGRTQYLEGHIPGAYYLDLDKDLSGVKQPHGGRHPLPDADELASKLGAAGVDERATVVVYDGGEGMAPRAWWLIRYLGHDNVHVLNGGWHAWLRAGGAASTDIPLPRQVRFPLRVRQDWIVSVDFVESVERGEARALLVDARAAERFRGDVEPIDAKAGHIPGAYNLPWEGNFLEDGTWRSAEELQARFAALQGQPVIAYCGSGVTACVNLLAMERAGIRGVKLYPGSWSDWSSYPEHEVETGDKSSQ